MNKVFSIIVVILAVALAGYYLYNAQKDSSQPTNQQEQTSMNNQEQQQATDHNSAQEQKPEQASTTPDASKKTYAVFDTSEGTFTVELRPDVAPKHVANFVKLAKDGYYVGTKFHRIMDGFMIQGGDPNSKNNDPSDDGQGGPGYTVPAEISLKHTKGALAAARTGDAVNPKKESSGSQFYVTLEATPFLDGQYTVYGYVSSGMDIVSKIGKTPTEPNPYSGESSTPLKDVIINKVTIEEK
jgi:cyclophilin family peptidyl-prolyl cis-trans isomerase